MSGPVQTVMRAKLAAAFGADGLLIEDDSGRHAGHAGVAVHQAKQGGSAAGVGETHFNVTIVSPVFEGLSRVARQRAVFAVLKDELAGPVHALALTCRTPSEAG